MHLRAEDDAEVQDAERLERLQLLPKLEYFRSDHDFSDLMSAQNAGSTSSWEPGTLKRLERCTMTVRPYYRNNKRILELTAGSKMKVLKLITCETRTDGGFQPHLAPNYNDGFNLGRFPQLEKSSSDPCLHLHSLSFRVLYWGFRNNLCRNDLIDHANSRKSWSRLVKALVSGKYPALRCVRFDITARLKMRTYDTTQEENRMRVAIEGYFESFLVSRSSGVQLELNICVRRLKQALGQSPDGSEWEESDDHR
ncbi:hypothetical protein BJ165DRAFT_1524923 [Panaeolus papilionaceus]|nr:hypothetical protein BJ165DRAFT_1524923 [Panaeolus papilionaceus]